MVAPGGQTAAAARPSLLLIGMRGAGKTTLGAIAAEHMGADFVDADELFSARHTTPAKFVAAHGWPAFRAAETELLRELIATCPAPEERNNARRPQVISLGGGVVEEATNRALLRAFWQGTHGTFRRGSNAVVHIFREMDIVLSEGERAGGRSAPKWTNGLAPEVWQRRRPWFRDCSSHEFVNMSLPSDTTTPESSLASRRSFEEVERDFVLFLHRLLVDTQPAHQPLNQDQRSYLVTLPFPDLRPHVDILPTLAVGASAVELRADLLFDPDPVRASTAAPEAYENPSLSYISEQMALLRRYLPDVPVVFTLRTPGQGGKYPFPADAPAEALFATMHHALKLGAEYVDVEQGLEAVSSQRLIRDAKERGASVIVSWRDTRAPLAGGFAWDGEEAYAHYSRAVEAGADIVKMVGTAGEVADNFALRIFAAARERESGPPLSAYNMGERGRISRFLNALLASVTHPLAKELTRRGTVGSPSMTFRETQLALHLSGLLKVRHFYVPAHAPFVAWAEELGLPHLFHVLPDAAFASVEELQRATLQYSEPLGHGLCIPHALKNPVALARRSREAAAIDAVDTVHAVTRGEALEWVGAHVGTTALCTLIRRRMSPYTALRSGLRAVIIATQRDAIAVRSARWALSEAGMRSVEVLQPGERAADGGATVVVSVLDDAAPPLLPAWCEELLTSPYGGVVVECRTQAPELLTAAQQVPGHVWTTVAAPELAEQAARERFLLFTGRRAPPPRPRARARS